MPPLHPDAAASFHRAVASSPSLDGVFARTISRGVAVTVFPSFCPSFSSSSSFFFTFGFTLFFRRGRVRTYVIRVDVQATE